MMTSDSVSSQQVPAYFLQEASELLQKIDTELQTLQQDFGVQKVYALMRLAHTLKGAAASVGLDHITTTTHSLENVFRALCNPRAELTPAIESLVLDGYDCLQLLLSAQIAAAQIDESSVLDRMATVIAKLEKHLGHRFGQDGYLPTSSELGVDITQSVFEKGVTKHLQALENALKTPDPDTLAALLRSQAEIFSGLAESFNLPGFGDIVQTTLDALNGRPELVVQIAEIALEDYRAGQKRVLQGDRTQGGQPSLMLEKLGEKYKAKSAKNKWLGQVWNVLNQPIPGTSANRKQKNEKFLATPEMLSRVKSIKNIKDIDTIENPDIRPNADFPFDVSLGASTVNPSSPPELTQSPMGSNLKVSVDHLELFNSVIGDLLTQHNRQALYNSQLFNAVATLLNQLQQQQQQLNTLKHQAVANASHRSQPSLSPSPDHQPNHQPNHQFDTLEFDHYNELQVQIQSLLDTMVQQIESAEAIELFVRHSHQTLTKQQRLVRNLRETLVEARMQPVSQVFERFHQVLGRLKAQQGKDTFLIMEGGHVFVDKLIIEKLYEPLLHLVRNAFDHGIETAIERQQQGKREHAKIHLSAKQQGQHLLISVRDNGRGLNLDAIRQKAIVNQLVSPVQAQQLTAAEVSHLIFEPGFSTAIDVNDLSGRGFGLDIVRAQVQALQGNVSVTHNPGQGTCFTLEIPTQLTIAKLLLCQAGETLYTFMTDAIEQILIPKPGQLKTRNGDKVLSWQFEDKEQLIPIISLSDALSYSAVLPRTHWRENTTASGVNNPIILMRHQDRFLGLESDQLLGEQELVIRSLGEMEATPSYLYGCSILPDGRLSLVIDGVALILNILEQPSTSPGKTVNKRTQAGHNLPKSGTVAKPSILIVDDSITVRNTLAQGLQKAGYLVIQAKEGREALQKLEQELVTAILCDLEMPGMNGFDFLRARQQSPQLASIPTIMLTSRTGEKHRQLADELGATGYLTKPYLMPQLLETINHALGLDV